MSYYGYAGRILYVDLSSGDIRKEPLPPELAEKFIGGFGINYRLACDLLKPGVDPLSPDNPVIIGAGPLCGTIAPGSSKCVATYKRPIMGHKLKEKHAVASAVGGTKRFGTMLKCAGYDHVAITGRADKPCYLKIVDDDVEICDAGDLWGKKDIYETSDQLVNRYKGASGSCGVWAIGRAGEMLVRTAMAFVDKRGTMGRQGGGALLGSKNLKAVVTLGTRGVNVADPKRFMALVDQKRQEIIRHPFFLVSYPQDTDEYSHTASEREAWRETRTFRTSCTTCLGGECWCNVIREGRFAGEGMQGGSWGMVSQWEKNLGLECGEAIKFMDSLNRLGMDAFTSTKMFYFIIGLYKRGVISAKDTGNLDLKLCNYDCLTRIVDKIINREDIGDVMAEGWYPLFRKVGIDAGEDFEIGSVIFKGADGIADGSDGCISPRIFGNVVKPKPQHTHQATHYPRGEGIHRDTYWPHVRKSLNDVKRNFERMGTSKEDMGRVFTEEDFNTGRLEKHAEDASAVYNSLGICDISPYGLSDPTQDMPWLSGLYSAATGFQATPEELKRRGERVFNLEAFLNVREGFSREDCQFPSLWGQNIKTPRETLTRDHYHYLEDWFGRRLSEDDLTKMLDDYYDERGWDIERGIPTKEVLTKLGLGEFADML